MTPSEIRVTLIASLRAFETVPPKINDGHLSQSALEFVNERYWAFVNLCCDVGEFNVRHPEQRIHLSWSPLDVVKVNGAAPQEATRA